MDTRLATLDSIPDGLGPQGSGIAPGVGGDAGGREARRQARLAELEAMRDRVRLASEHLTRHICGELLPDEIQPFAHVADPCVTLTRLARAMRQIIALEERLDEDSESRARRLAEDAARREKAELAARAERAAVDKAEAIDAKKRLIRRAFTEASHELGPGKGLPRREREKLLDDLLSDYERYDDFDRDAVDIVTDLVREAELSQAGLPARTRAEPDPATASLQNLMTAIERRLLRLLGETKAEERDWPYLPP